MSSQQVNQLTETISGLQQELDVTRQQLGGIQTALRCSRIAADFPLAQHSQSRICQECFEILRVQHARVAVVLGSIISIVQESMLKGGLCPFCQQNRKHSDTCYLHDRTGLQILDEYRAIEQHRDMLLSDKARRDASSGSPPEIPRVRLKGRFHQDAPGG